LLAQVGFQITLYFFAQLVGAIAVSGSSLFHVGKLK
jgi:hypothetical protein